MTALVLPPDLRRELSHISSWKGLLAGAGVWCHIFAALLLFAVTPSPWKWVALPFLIVYQARNFNALAIVVHDAIHGHLHPSQSLNRFLGRWIFGAPILLGFSAYQKLHLSHHRLLHSKEDPDYPLYSGFPLSSQKFLVRLFSDVLGSQSFKKYVSVVMGKGEQQGMSFSDLAAIFFVQILVLAFSLFSEHFLTWFCLWFLPLISLMPVLFRLRAALEHGAMDGIEGGSRTIQGNTFSRFFLGQGHINFHLEHHLYPWVPPHQLSTLHTYLVSQNALPQQACFKGYKLALNSLLQSGSSVG